MSIDLFAETNGHAHSILVGKKCCYCMECGQILLEYKNKNDFKKFLKAFEALGERS